MSSVRESLYEHLFPLTTVMKQRVVENFDGDVLNERWQTLNNVGTGAFVMADGVDEGFEIEADNIVGSQQIIKFNNIRQYDNTSSVFIAIARALQTTSIIADFGLTFTGIGVETDAIQTGIATTLSTTDMFFRTEGSNTFTDTILSQSIDTNFHLFKLELTSANGTVEIDNLLKGTHTTDLPDLRLQPQFVCGSRVTSLRRMHINYIEAYNT